MIDDPSDIKLDSDFKVFFQYCKSQDIPVIVVSRYGEGVILHAHSSGADMSRLRTAAAEWNPLSARSSPIFSATTRMILI